MIFYETDTQCRAENIEIKLRTNGIELECYPHTIRKLTESDFHRILHN